MCDKIIAKKLEDGKEQSLLEHTIEVIEAALKFIDEDVLKLVAKCSSYDKEKLRELIFYALFFHDLGKATQEFKRTVDEGTKSFHALYSAAVVSTIEDFELDFDEESVNLLFLIVLTHHTMYKKDIYQLGVKKYTYNFLVDCAIEFFSKYKVYYEKYLKKICNYDFEFKVLDEGELKEKSMEELKTALELIGKREREGFRLLYAYVSGILNLADWYASAKFSENLPIVEFKNIPNKDFLLEGFKESINKRKKNEKEPLKKFIPKKFQKELGNINGNVLVEIPTGEGKTEGALLWAVNNIKNEHSKIIYTLPTQTTSNKLYERLQDVFKEFTGLVHGAAKVYFEELYENEEADFKEDFNTKILFEKTFNKPVTISTIDGLFKFFINIGRYNVATVNILNSVIIIDEVHSYDLKLMGFMKRFFKIAKKYNIPICVMSASIPNKVKQLLGLDKFATVTDEKLFEKKAVNIIKHDRKMDEHLDYIIEEYRKGKNVLVVKNKIAHSVKMYDRIVEKLKDAAEEGRVVLYNSRFKKIDRVEKEKEIYKRLKNKENFILVATQVVEISLDIDFDVLFTDKAPIDALIQRFGRVNRDKSSDRIANVHIFNIVKEKEKYPYMDEIMDLSYKTIEEGIYPISKYREWINIVYDSIYSTKKMQSDIQNKFEKGEKYFDKLLKDLRAIEIKSIKNDNEDSKYDLRDIEIPTEDFILKDDYHECNYSYKNTVAMPSYYWGKYQLKGEDTKTKKGLFYRVLSLDYSYERGVLTDLKKDAGHDML